MKLKDLDSGSLFVHGGRLCLKVRQDGLPFSYEVGTARIFEPASGINSVEEFNDLEVEVVTNVTVDVSSTATKYRVKKRIRRWGDSVVSDAGIRVVVFVIGAVIGYTIVKLLFG